MLDLFKLKTKIMKKTLLTLAAFSFVAFASAQGIITQNFNGLNVGNIGTDITGMTAGQAGFLTLSSNGVAPTTSTNAGNDNFQVIAGDAAHGNVLQVTGPNGDKGSRFMYNEGLDAFWDARADGQDIIEIDWSFYSGPETTSKNQMRGVLYNEDGTKILGGLSFAMNTKILSAIAYYDNSAASGGSVANYLFNLAAGGLVLEADTWYTFGISFNNATGDIIVRTGDGEANNAIPGAAAGETPTEFNIIATSGSTAVAGGANLLAATGLYDNLVIRTSSEDTLLGVADNAAQATAISVYPNPASDVINISGGDVKTVSFADINGRTVKSLNVNSTQATISVSDLSTGVYMMTIETADGATTTKKLLKK